MKTPRVAGNLQRQQWFGRRESIPYLPILCRWPLQSNHFFTWINRKNIKSGCWAKNVSNTERPPTKHLLPKRHQMTFLHCALFQMCVTVWLQCSIPIGILHVSASSLTILMFSSLQFCHSLVFIYVFKWCIQLVWYVYIQCHVNILTANLIAWNIFFFQGVFLLREGVRKKNIFWDKVLNSGYHPPTPWV